MIPKTTETPSLDLVEELKTVKGAIAAMRGQEAKTNWDFAPSDKKLYYDKLNELGERVSAITKELDSRCHCYGLSLQKTDHKPILRMGAHVLANRGSYLLCMVFATELHTLLGYLLSKESGE